MRTLEEIQRDINLHKKSISSLKSEYYEVLKIFQKSCNHNWEWEGSGHGKNMYKCTICNDVKFEIQ